MTLGNHTLAGSSQWLVCSFPGGETSVRIAVTVARSIPERGNQVFAQMPWRCLTSHQMQNDIVEQGRHQLVSLIRVDAHPPSLVPKKWRIEEKQLAYRALIAMKDGGKQARGRRITRGGELLALALANVVAPLH
ncbi:MAG TPA: hypothetical protein VLJ83_02125 [Gemmatimonadaceae bacterium]|nr:hypothetical protein [Gemmatimonadaceae bacterium]